MSLTINQSLPTNNTVVSSVTSSSSKTDLCSGLSLDGLLNKSNLPDMSMPDIDLPSFKVLNGLSLDILPDFTKFKIDGLKGSGLYNPFECSLIDKLKPKTSNLKFKQNIDKLKDINCNDNTANLNTDGIKGKVLETAIGASDCAKSIIEATVDLSNDLHELGLTPSIENDKTAKTLIGSVVDNKFDVSTASKLLNDDDTILKINETLLTKSTPIDKALKVSKATNAVSDKDSIVDYATRLTDKKNIAKVTDSQLLHLSTNATKDSSSKIDALPTSVGALSNSQSISLLHKANNLTKSRTVKKLIA